MLTVVTSSDLLRTICAYQVGVYDICREPWVAKQWARTKAADLGASSSFHRDSWGISAFEYDLFHFQVHFGPWYACHGVDGAKRLVACKPALLSWVLDHSVRHGDANLLAALPANTYTTPTMINVAAYYGHLRVLQLLMGNQAPGFSSAAVHAAAYRGHMHVVQWLVARGVRYAETYTCLLGGTFTVDAMGFAAEAGHLDVVMYLFGVQTLRNVSLAINKAAVQGHVHVFDFLYRATRHVCSTNALEFAQRRGHTELLAYLAAHHIEARDQ
ncbi:hypothetical protein SDRG_14698 [Saprolegnia diclina VS20]|uniref:Uncharacterized protein n=1 Tax=Saprolegnia diclina (strain VS20) TaxID=1156394 RepID=T0Q2A2_SAPDV|nr:hypothetical protein SDRG_14698 [Saprolegnia diclina VS20]EQC27495.1 hypothetical protein SDRG_14698 [Saprolegnia diclina VS20]|eukprot:XP_008619069.1 hypothetical protein SDRG_14698 [Saprolegnia diclina VS20]